MKQVLEGSHAVSRAVRLARVKVISAYPITPQTHIVEALSAYCADGSLDAKFICVESEHSAMAAAIGASLGGVRTFTATSSHGLAYMHELLHWASASRLPIVMAEVNRALGPGWNIWTDQSDSLAQRDTGWIQLYCEDGQDVLDTTLMAFRLAETVNLPVMVVLDAFFLSHTFEPVDEPDAGAVDAFLPPYAPRFRMDLEKPFNFGQMVPPGQYMEMRYSIQQGMDAALRRYEPLGDDFARHFGRAQAVVEPVNCRDARIVIVTSGTVTSTCREVIGRLRREGEPVGLLKIKMFRPFPFDLIREHLGGVEKVAVIDRNVSFGACGIFAQEVRAALCSLPARPQVFGYIAGLGGRDITPQTIEEIYNRTCTEPQPAGDGIWIGLDEEVVNPWRS
jgi:pyruvate/2-oxoacid:ferredoxin oxidoreductase alpha subunit